MAKDKETDAPKEKAVKGLDDLTKYITSRMGTGNGIRAGNRKDHITHISTGCFLLDMSLMGGMPENQIITYVGKPGAGKTTMTYKAIANFQKKYNGETAPKRKAVYINAEVNGYDATWAESNDVDTEDLMVITPTTGEEAVDITCAAFANPDVGFLVFDSIPSLVGEKELEKSSEDGLQPGQVAGLASRMMRKIQHVCSASYNAEDKKTFIGIQQWRVGISTTGHAPRTMPGGTYYTHFQSNCIDFKKSKEVLGRDENGNQLTDYNIHTFENTKVRTGNSLKEGEFTLMRNTDSDMPVGTIDDFNTVVTYAQRFGLAGGAGKGWWLADPETGEEMKFASKEAITTYVKENANTYFLLKRKIISLHRKKNGMTEHNWW